MPAYWLNSLISVFIISLASLIGLIAFSIKIEKLKKLLSFLISFAAGALLGGTFIHILPEVSEKSGFGLDSSLLVLGGMIFFFILEKIICWRHCHIPTSKSHPHSLGIMNLIGDGLHNFTDGIIIAAAFMTSYSLGIATSLAVLFHEIPQEIGDFSVLVYAGFSKVKALVFNFLSAGLAVLGVLIVLIAGKRLGALVDYLLPLTAGGFLYIASADLMPEMKKENSSEKVLLQFLSLGLGIGIMALIK